MTNFVWFGNRFRVDENTSNAYTFRLIQNGKDVKRQIIQQNDKTNTTLQQLIKRRSNVCRMRSLPSASSSSLLIISFSSSVFIPQSTDRILNAIHDVICMIPMISGANIARSENSSDFVPYQNRIERMRRGAQKIWLENVNDSAHTHNTITHIALVRSISQAKDTNTSTNTNTRLQ